MDDLAFIRREELLGAPMATLTRRADTPEAKSLVGAVVAVLEDHESSQGTRKRKRDDEAQRGLDRAVEAFLGDLYLGARKAKGAWVYRSRHTNSFTGEEVSARHFKAVVDAMEPLGLIEIVKGFNAPKIVQWEGFPDSRYQQGKAARYRATQVLLELGSRAGVEVIKAGRHFQEPKPTELVILKDSSHWEGKDKIPGKRISFLKTPHVDHIEAEVRLINAFLEGVNIQGGIHRGFYTVYNMGNIPGFNWNKGGRLYSVGNDSYQRDSGETRRNMALDGEPVAELDIRASYLTVLHGKLGVPLKADGDDLYEVPGISNRDIVKGWLIATLSKNGHLKRWPKEQAKAFLKDNGRDLEQAYPIQTVKEAMVTKYPVLKSWGQVEVDWGDLMWAEAKAIRGAIIQLIKTRQVPSLPVHDSLLVPVSAILQAMDALTDNYKYHCKIEPRIKINPEKWDI
ncbi:hypothetical protein [Microvirga zambiensis]|uniref:hypothetical protein n=1 Tax=Microvirga zambiensis TaxID=1402137 RepID=UPI00191E95B4|nr:hypothetical protein [Microvirga zambiensis]